MKVRPHFFHWRFRLIRLIPNPCGWMPPAEFLVEFFTQFGLPGFPLCGGGSVELSSSEGEPALPSWLGTDDLMICKKQCVDVVLQKKSWMQYLIMDWFIDSYWFVCFFTSLFYWNLKSCSRSIVSAIGDFTCCDASQDLRKRKKLLVTQLQVALWRLLRGCKLIEKTILA